MVQLTMKQLPVDVKCPCTTEYIFYISLPFHLFKNYIDRGLVTHHDYFLQNGLMVAAYKGFLPIVYELHGCPHLDINHQDNDGNTALMIAAQAGQLLHV